MTKYIKNPYIYNEDNFDTEVDYIKRVRKQDREEEFEKHGKYVSIQPTRIHKNKNRNKFDYSRDRKIKHNYFIENDNE